MKEEKYRFCGNRPGCLVAGPAIVALLLGFSQPSHAQFSVAATGSTRYEYDSNVFDLQRGVPVPGTGDFQHSDRLYTYGAALDLNYLWDRQKFFVRLADNEFRYDHFTPLDHNEYDLDAGLNWKASSLFDGTVEAVRIRSLVSFSNVTNTTFDLQTEQREAGTIGFNFHPDWRIEGVGNYRAVDQVFVNQPSINLRESDGGVALQYLGRAGLTAGLSGTFTEGHYTGPSAALNPSYSQDTYSLTALYKPTGRSSINGVIGYSDRRSASSLNSLSGFTGLLEYDDQLTGKTSLHFQLSRLINSYVANVGSEIDSIATIAAHWQATYRLGVLLGYNWNTRALPGQGNSPPGSTRVDHLHYASLNLVYEPVRWISIKPYLNFQTRKSDFVGGDFDATIVGVYVTATWEERARPDPAFQRMNQPTAIP